MHKYKKINPNMLHDELIKNNIIPVSVVHTNLNINNIAEETTIIFKENTDMDKVKSIVENHNPMMSTLEVNFEKLALYEAIANLQERLNKIESGEK